MVHDGLFPPICSNGHASSQDLSEGCQVRYYPGQGLHATIGHSEPGDDLIKDQQDVQFGAEISQTLQKTPSGRNTAHITRDRFHDQRGQIVSVGAQQAGGRFQIVKGKNQGFRGIGGRDTRAVRYPQGHDAGSRSNQKTIGMAVITSLKFGDLVLPGDTSSQSQSAHDSLGT